ncbi:MAG: ribonuclease HI family protein [Candidatus Omnitrophica bacterium]|nr:ribonuclease HI family protein [Candidatus Omnitrophota bacterium]
MSYEDEFVSLFIDGASRGNPGPAGIGVVFRNGTNHTLKEFGKFIGETTNNVAEYTALIYGLQEALIQKVKRVTVYTDSELLARQIQGKYKVKEPHLKVLRDQVRYLIQGFNRFGIHHLPRRENRQADKLANQAIDAMQL